VQRHKFELHAELQRSPKPTRYLPRSPPMCSYETQLRLRIRIEQVQRFEASREDASMRRCVFSFAGTALSRQWAPNAQLCMISPL